MSIRFLPPRNTTPALAKNPPQALMSLKKIFLKLYSDFLSSYQRILLRSGYYQKKKTINQTSSKEKPTPVTPKETKFTPSLNTQLINCGLVLYKGSKPANDPLLFNIKQTVDIKNPDLFEELQHLSLLNGHSRLTDLDSLIYVIHKSTNKKPVQVDLAYQHPTEEKKTRKYVEDDSDSDDDSNIVQIQPKNYHQLKLSLQAKCLQALRQLRIPQHSIQKYQNTRNPGRFCKTKPSNPSVKRHTK
ncbi:hypothetical protein H4Q26_005229 [Puccinia striiformis f. sp. tritici PST-130]|nr:hypothetical protein H4Q26_005229 [Puccinia striiformis f. sp. tritici PST-130]